MTQTGPTTPEAKLVVSRNSIRHGLRTQAIVIPGMESEDEWAEFHAAVFEAMAPDGAVGAELTQRVAETMWRLRRVAPAEHAAVVYEHECMAVRARSLARDQVRFAAQLSEDDIGPPEARLPTLPPEKTRDAIARYEAHLNRQLYQALHELEAARDRRAGRPAPLGRIDLNAAQP